MYALHVEELYTTQHTFQKQCWPSMKNRKQCIFPKLLVYVDSIDNSAGVDGVHVMHSKIFTSCCIADSMDVKNG